MNRTYRNFVILSWNVRGLGQIDKCDVVRDNILRNHPNIVCLQETKLMDIVGHDTRAFLPANLNTFFAAPADGTRGGLLTAWDSNSFAASSQQTHRFATTVTFQSTSSNLSFAITNVYGPANHSLSDAFLDEIYTLSTVFSGLWFVVGDFNLTRDPSDKNTAPFNSHLASRFNSAIDSAQLIELSLLDRRYTWTNSRSSPTLARLDRAFFNLPFSDIFPGTSLTSGLRPTSDHIPLIATIKTNIPKPKTFRLERSWLLDPSFLPTVLPAWSAAQHSGGAAGEIAARIKAVRHASKVWLRKHRSPPHIYHNCHFIIHMFDLFEEIYQTFLAIEKLLIKRFSNYKNRRKK
jgi:exonuclease III